MSEGNTDAREVAASIFAGAGTSATILAAMVPDPARAALLVGSKLANAIAKLITSIGTDNVAALIEELQRRKDEGKITDSHVARDNTAIAGAVSDMFRDSDEKE